MKIRLSVLTMGAIALAACQPKNAEQQQAESKPQVKEQAEVQLTPLKQFAKQLDVDYRLVTNVPDPSCERACFSAAIDIRSDMAFAESGWQIFFSHVVPIISDSSEQFDIEHINGDLHKITPTAAFTGFTDKSEFSIDFLGQSWHVSEYQLMPNYFIVDAKGNAELISSTEMLIDKETNIEYLQHAKGYSFSDTSFKQTPEDNTPPADANWLYQRNKDVMLDKEIAKNAIIPTPVKVELSASDRLSLKQGVNVASNSFSAESVTASLERLATLGVATTEDGVAVNITKSEEITTDGYVLSISNDGINVVAGTAAGAFYGMQSVAALLDPETLEVATGKVEDAPRFDFRGMHLDVSRNFKSKEFVLRLLEQMAAYKLNKFHFHLADDESWRVEIAGLPELTEVGAYRCFDPKEDNCLQPQLGSGPNKDISTNGYYSIAEYKEILAFAKARHIEVIPSMDMPGHSRAVIKSMEARARKLIAKGDVDGANEFLLSDAEDSTEYSSIQHYKDNTINVCMDSTYVFLGKVIDELKVMHNSVGLPMTRYHIGADETAGAWLKSPACKELLENNIDGIDSAEKLAAYFVERVSNQLAKTGVEPAGWSDGMGHTRTSVMPSIVQSNAWTPLYHNGSKAAHEQVNRGWEVVISTPDAYYFDMPYRADPKESGYYWASRHVDTRKTFSFMPENLPANAEQYRSNMEDNFSINDAAPMEQGKGFKGVQGQFWGETIRSDNQAEYMIYPRLLALAERAWHEAEWEVPYSHEPREYSAESGFFSAAARQQQLADWQRFANVLGQKELTKLGAGGINYRLPRVGAVIEDGKLHANTVFPGLTIWYKQGDAEWQTYQQPVNVEAGKPVYMRTQLPQHSRVSRTIQLNP